MNRNSTADQLRAVLNEQGIFSTNDFSRAGYIDELLRFQKCAGGFVLEDERARISEVCAALTTQARKNDAMETPEFVAGIRAMRDLEKEIAVNMSGKNAEDSVAHSLTFVARKFFRNFRNVYVSDHQNETEFFTIDLDWLDYTVNYRYVKSDGSLASAAEPTVNGTYQVTVNVPATSNTKKSTANHRYEIVIGDEVYIYSSITLPISVTGTLPVDYYSVNGEPIELWFDTSDDSVVYIDDNGILTTESVGTATITVGSMNDSATATCVITVCNFENTLTLPSALMEIDEEAFFGNSVIQYVKLGNRVSSIGSKAFASMTGLSVIDIPDSVTYIADNAFYGDSPVIICTAGSAAESFAMNHGLQYMKRQ